MGAQQDQRILLTPTSSKRTLNIDSMISQIDADARQRREGEKKNSVNSCGKRCDVMPLSLADEFPHMNKRQRVSLEVSPTRVLAFDEACPSTPLQMGILCPSRRSNLEHNLGIRLRPRNLDTEFGRESRSSSSSRDLPFMPF